jgi:hypothetical protein
MVAEKQEGSGVTWRVVCSLWRSDGQAADAAWQRRQRDIQNREAHNGDGRKVRAAAKDRLMFLSHIFLSAETVI